ncbi:MAG TPA: ATP-binding protein [Terriglobales bacterium]|nr:ATP-binding protein [Terriglobales bacterium]
MSKSQPKRYEPVNAAPVKSFFVHMLTRDIRLEDAILDLLDNCVDGILRNREEKGAARAKKPYDGFWAEIEFQSDSFTISDNCGGIPWSLHDYAFRMGPRSDRPEGASGSIGVYGIGMKRAIFKMGKRCLISTQNAKDAYDVEIDPDWTNDESDWKIPVRPATTRQPHDGTTVYISDLHGGVAKRFGEDAQAFQRDLEAMVATQYVSIIDKGFRVRINGELIKPRPINIVFDKKAIRGREAIRPYIFKAQSNGVQIFLAVGFTRPIPSQDEVLQEQEEKKYSTLDAGWTILCNDRAVVYCDRTELTGWGEAGVPRYHTQFIAISGIVEFRSDDPAKLPTTTTKRGVDASSPLYLQIKNKMRDGMAIFTSYTNKWKLRPEESRKQIEKGEQLSFEELKAEALHLPLNATKGTVPQGEQFRPSLPLPAKIVPSMRRISFTKRVYDVRKVAEYLFEDPEVDPSDVGEKCFDITLAEAVK